QDGAGGGAGVPDVADDPRAHLRREAGEGDVELGGLVVRLLAARVPALGQDDDLPAPVQDRVLLDVDLHLLGDGRAVVLAPEVEHAGLALAAALEAVLRAAPVLAFPAAAAPPLPD